MNGLWGCDLRSVWETQDDKDMKSSVVLLAAMLFLLVGTAPGFSESEGKVSFEANEVLWTVTLRPMESFNSDFADQALEINSDPETGASVQPAWVGDDPGDVGPLWIIQDLDESVMGACWSLYESDEIECIPLFVPLTHSLD
jgi:hypothetical protein